MNEQKGENYSFCPKCGALMEDGKCPECAEKEPEKGEYSSMPYPGRGENQRSNEYYAQPYANSGYRPYDSQMPPKKDNKIWLIAAVAAAVFILLAAMIGSFFYGYFIVKFSKEGAEIFSEEFGREENFFGHGSNDADSWEGMEDEDANEQEEYMPSPLDEYYYGPCDSINEEVPYSFIHKTYSNEDADNDIDIVINYLELKGNEIPNIEQLNQELEAQALYYTEDFLKDTYYAEYGESFAAYISSYVTYNDEDIVSIVLDEYVAIDDMYHVDLYSINIDLKNGVILDNGSLLQIDEEFAEEFRRRSNEQNGHIDYLDALSNGEAAKRLQDKTQMIAYYTPLGMEIGLNYHTDTDGGWFTVTYKDYEDYLKKF